MNEEIKKAVNVAKRAQRNYDLSKSIPKNDLETLIYTAKNSPSKQNETHYSLYIYTDKDIIREIYNTTKKFILYKQNDIVDILDPNNNKNEQWMYDNTSVYNSQILANVLFVYVDHNGSARGVTHMLAKHDDTESNEIYNIQKNYSIGISVGQLTLAATLLGYKTGICSAFDPDQVQEIIKSNNTVKLLVGIGYENIGVDRRFHAETLNKEILENFRNGDLDEKWRFPSFQKYTRVLINGKEQ